MIEIMLLLSLGAITGELLRLASRVVWRYSPAGWWVFLMKRIETWAFKLRTTAQHGNQLQRERRQAREAAELREILEECGGVAGLRRILDRHYELLLEPRES